MRFQGAWLAYALRRTRRSLGLRARQTQGREGVRREAAGARSSLTLARGGVARRDRSPRGAAAGASSCWPRGRRRGPARRPAPRTQNGCAGPGVPTSGGGGGYHASADGPRPSRVLVPADCATLRLRLLCKPPAIRALPHALPAGAGQEPDPERGRRGATGGLAGGQAGSVFAEGLRGAPVHATQMSLSDFCSLGKALTALPPLTLEFLALIFGAGLSKRGCSPHARLSQVICE